MNLIGYMYFFRYMGDLLHVLAITILLNKILRTRSCAGVSSKSQILYVIVFITRYFDLASRSISFYNFGMNNVFLFAHLTLLFLIFVIFRQTYDRKLDSFRVEVLLIPAAILACYVNYQVTMSEVLSTFSIYLEAVAILPQLFMLGERGQVECTIYHYLFALGVHRVFYLIYWILNSYVNVQHYNVIPMWSSVVQTILYWELFYIYFTKVLWSESYVSTKLNGLSLDQLREVVHQEFNVNAEKSEKDIKQSMENQPSLKKSPSVYSAIYSVDI